MKRCRFWTAIPGSNTEKELFLIFSVFGGFDDNIPVTIIPRNAVLRKGYLYLDQKNLEELILEDVCVEECVFRNIPTALCILLDKGLVRELPLGVLVKIFHVRVSGSIVKMKMGLFEGLSMVSLGVRETKQTFLQEITVQSFSKLSLKICEVKGISYSCSFQKTKEMF